MRISSFSLKYPFALELFTLSFEPTWSLSSNIFALKGMKGPIKNIVPIIKKIAKIAIRVFRAIEIFSHLFMYWYLILYQFTYLLLIIRKIN